MVACTICDPLIPVVYGSMYKWHREVNLSFRIDESIPWRKTHTNSVLHCMGSRGESLWHRYSSCERKRISGLVICLAWQEIEAQGSMYEREETQFPYSWFLHVGGVFISTEFLFPFHTLTTFSPGWVQHHLGVIFSNPSLLTLRVWLSTRSIIFCSVCVELL